MRSESHPYTNQSSDRKASIRSVGLEDFDREVLKEKMPVLVLCMHRDSDFPGQIEVIQRVVTKTCGDRLKVCLLKEDSVGVFRETYGVGGTPTFLLFRGGREMSRLLGQAEPGVLKEFLSRTVSSDIGGE